MTLLELAEKAGVKFHRCDAAWGGTWGWSIDESCKFNGSESQEAACESWARTTFGEGAYEAVKSLLAENAKHLTENAKRLESQRKAVRRHREKHRDKVRDRHNTYDKARNDKSRATAKNVGQKWSDQDKRLLFDKALTDREIAAKLGRSIRAVMRMRTLCHHMAPEGWVAKGTPAKPVQEVK